MSHNKRPFNRNSRFKNSRSQFKSSHNQQTREYVHKNQLSETDVGITEYLNKSEGFSGIIKARFSDFQVNEIDLDGKIAKLTDTSIPKDFQKKNDEKPLEEILESPINEIPQNIWDSILALVKSSGEEVVELDVKTLSKEDRTKIHECIRTYFSGKLMANTVVQDDKSIIQFKKYNPNSSTRNNFKWPEDKGEYVHFLVYKETLDTLDASLLISDCLKMSAPNFNYAGVKDKRAKTTQWFSVRKVEPWKLIVKTKSIRNIKIGNLTFKESPLKLGQLLGNRFRIALRNVTGSDEAITESLNSIKDKGFINYYGLQRFGNDKEKPTFSIGVQLLLGNWKEACDIILKPTESSDPNSDTYKAKKVYLETGDATKALKELQNNKNKCIEGKLLLGLSKNNLNDYVNALENIPRNTRLLYLHSFQSLVWNRVVSKRISQYGLEPVEGDLVLINESNTNCEEDEESSEDDSETSKKQEVKALTVEDCKNYTIYDIVLPLPGYDVIYPENMKDFYKEILESYGLALEMTKQKVQTYTLSGNYRKILGKLQDFSWKIMKYNDPNYNLIRSDFEELRGQEEPKTIEDGQYKALVLEFSLDSSSYATMVLREILKTDTSSSSHAKLNNYHKSNEVTNSNKKIEINSVNSQEQVDEISNGHKSFLNDSEGYEAFKNLIFNTNGKQEKREIEEDNDSTNNNKKLKTN